MTNTAITTISDLRYKTQEVLDSADNGPVTILHHATPKGVLLSIKEYEQIMSTLEDYYLSLRAEEYEKEDKSTVSWISEKTIREQTLKP